MIENIEQIKKLMLTCDWQLVIKKIIGFIEKHFEQSRAKKIIIGLSGGIDSSTTLALLIRSIGKENVIALVMPHYGITEREDLEDAYMVADKFGVEYINIELADICSNIKHRLSPFIEIDKKTYGNIIARTRMIVLYAFSNSMNGIVAGTSDKSERTIGYFTKWGDAAADIFPIVDLYKTQVREVARQLGVPNKIIMKPSSPGLWKGHLAEEEMGITYDKIDPILFAINELKIPPEKVKEIDGIDPIEVDHVIGMIETSEHKKAYPYPKVQDIIKGE